MGMRYVVRGWRVKTNCVEASRRKMGGAHLLKRIPRIKFPPRHPKSSASARTQDAASTSIGSDVPAAPKNLDVGGKASLQPERLSITAREIDAIILGGYI